MTEITSQWYPYLNVQESYINMEQAPQIPRMICDYLIDAPDPKTGYKPVDDNSRSRVRFWKYLYYDEAKPLTKKLPTAKEKLSVVFDPTKPETPPTDKGYRLIPQYWIKQSQTEAQTRVFVFTGRTVPDDEFMATMAVHFRIMTHYTYEANTKSDEYNRTLALEQALIEAFNGVNMTGIGTFMYSRRCHPDCGSKILTDGNTNVGREVVFGLQLATTKNNTLTRTDNMPSANSSGSVKLGW